MTLSDMAPAIIAVLFTGGSYLCALRIRHNLREARRVRHTPAE